MAAEPPQLTPEVALLFEQESVETIKNIEAESRRTVEAKQSELRKLVGERYRDLLDSTDILDEMQAHTARLLSALREAKELSQGASRLRMGEQEEALEEVEEESRRAYLARRLKRVVDCDEHIWSLLDEHDFFGATQHYLEVLKVLEEMRNAPDVAELLGEHAALVHSQAKVVGRFPQVITVASSEWLLRSTLSSLECAGALVALVVLDRQPAARILQLFLERRTHVVEANLNPEVGEETVAHKMCAVADAIKQTLTHVHEVFGGAKPLFGECLSLLGESSPLEENVIQQLSSEWMSAMAKNVLERGAPLLDSEQLSGSDLQAVRQKIWERTSDSEVLWDGVFRPTLVAAAKRLIERLWSDDVPVLLGAESASGASLAARVWSGGPAEREDVEGALQRLEERLSQRLEANEWLDEFEVRPHFYQCCARWLNQVVEAASEHNNLAWGRLCRRLGESKVLISLFSNGEATDVAKMTRGLSSRTEALLARYTSKRANAFTSASSSPLLAELRGKLHAQDVRSHTLWCQRLAKERGAQFAAELRSEYQRARPERSSEWFYIEKQQVRVPHYPSRQLFGLFADVVSAVNREGAYTFQPGVLRCLTRLLGARALEAYRTLGQLDRDACVQVVCDLMVLQETLSGGSTANEDVQRALGGAGDASNASALTDWTQEVGAAIQIFKGQLDAIDVAFYQPHLETTVSEFLARSQTLLQPLTQARSSRVASASWDAELRESVSSLSLAPQVYPFKLLPLGTRASPASGVASHNAAPDTEFDLLAQKKKQGSILNGVIKLGSGFFSS